MFTPVLGVPIVGDHGLEAITAEQIGKNKGIVTKCNGDGDCPMSYHYVYRNMKGYCYCGPEPKDPSVSIAGPTTAENLTSRLLPQPLKFPTAIPADEWVAIQASLVLLDDHIKSQADLYRVCTGAEDPQVYGFKLEVFRKVCNPEITMPAPSSEIVKARNRVLSALYIDTILEQNSNDFGAACEEAKSPNTPDRGFDNEWIVSVLCSEAR